MTYRGPWNAAGWKQRNPSRERKMSTRVMEGGSDRKPPKQFTVDTAVGQLTVVSHPNHFGPPVMLDAKPLAYEPPRHQICKTHDLWSVNRDDTCASCTVRGWLGKKAKSVEVQADLQPVNYDGAKLFDPSTTATVSNELNPQSYAEVIKALRDWKANGYAVTSSTVDLKPLSPAYLDGIDEALERASGSASSGLTGIDEGK